MLSANVAPNLFQEVLDKCFAKLMGLNPQGKGNTMSVRDFLFSSINRCRNGRAVGLGLMLNQSQISANRGG